MTNLTSYLKNKQIRRDLGITEAANIKRELGLIYRAMSDDEKAALASHKATITFNSDLRDLKAIKEKYALSYNELKTIISTFA